MDKIKFIINEVKVLNDSTKEYDISVYLNDIKLPHSFLSAEEVLSLPNYSFAEFNLFTCGCGVAGCAGFHEKIIYEKNGNVVSWTFPKENYYCTEKKIYNFDENEFKNEFEQLIKKMLQMEMDKIFHTSFIKDESRYIDDEDTEKSNNYVEIISIEDAIKWASSRYKSYEDFRNTLLDNAPNLMNKNFKYIYDNNLSENTLMLSDIVCNLLNNDPRNNVSPFFLKKTKLAIKAVNNFVNGDSVLFQKIAKHNYERNGFSSFYLIQWYFPNMQEKNLDDFDIKKLKLVLVN